MSQIHYGWALEFRYEPRTWWGPNGTEVFLSDALVHDRDTADRMAHDLNKRGMCVSVTAVHNVQVIHPDGKLYTRWEAVSDSMGDELDAITLRLTKGPKPKRK